MTALFYLVGFLRGIDVLMGRAVGPLDVLSVFALLTPQYMMQVAPLALVLGTVQGLGRMTDEGEVSAAQALGQSPATLLLAPLVLGVALTSGLLVVSQTVQPWGVTAVRARVLELLKRNLIADVRPGHFFQGLEGLALSVDDNDGVLWRRVLIHDARAAGGASLTLADEARPTASSDGLRFELVKGTTYAADGVMAEVTATFERGVVHAGLGQSVSKASSFRFAREELSLSQLLALSQMSTPEDALRGSLMFHERLRQTLVPLALSLLSGALALRRRRSSGAGAAVGITVGVYIAYHLVSRTAQTWGERGELSPWFASLLPNLLTLGVGLVAGWRLHRRGAA